MTDKPTTPDIKGYSPVTDDAKVLPSITMKTATGEILMGWLASQTDMLSDDWMILP